MHVYKHEVMKNMKYSFVWSISKKYTNARNATFFFIFKNIIIIFRFSVKQLHFKFV